MINAAFLESDHRHRYHYSGTTSSFTGTSGKRLALTVPILLVVNIVPWRSDMRGKAHFRSQGA